MDTVELIAYKRNPAERARSLRAAGKIPAEFYGKGVSNLSLAMDYQTFRKIFRSAGENTILDLNVEGEGSWKALIHEVQYDPRTDAICHVDFINVRMDQEVHTHIPLEFIGISNAVKNMAGILNTGLHEIEVKCLPKYLVHSIQVDLSALEDFSSVIHLKDLNVPEGLTVLNDLEQMVATVTPPREEEIEMPAVEEAAVPPEVAAEAAAAEEAAKASKEPKKEE